MPSSWALVGSAFLVAAAFAAIALQNRGNAGLPDLLMEVPLGGEMRINTANGPMLVSVGKHMQCQQCQSFHQKGLSQLASCPCSVPVSGSKDGVYYEGVIKVTRTDKVVQTEAPKEEETPSDSEEEPEEEEDEEDYDKGCRTKPMHLRVTAKGSFLDGVPVFPGDEKTETMLAQLFQFFGGTGAGAVLDGTLTCKQEWDLEHPDYLVPKPGFPSDVAVKIPHGSTLEPLKDELSPFKTMIPQVLRQKYGDKKDSSRLRRGLEQAMQSNLFQRDAADFRQRQSRGRGGATEFSRGASNRDIDSTQSLRSSPGGASMTDMLRELSEKVNKIADKTSKMDGTLRRVNRVMNWGRQ